MTLRRFYRITTSVSFGLVVLLAFSLFALTTMQRRFNEEQARSLESISAVLTLEVALFEYNRLSNLYQLTAEPDLLADREELRDRINLNLSTVRRLAELEQEEEQIGFLQTKLTEYFRIRQQVDSSALPYETKVERVTVPLEATLQLVEGLNLYYRSHSMQANREIARWDRNANMISLLVIILAIALSAWAIAMAQRLVIRPLAQAERGVRRFSIDPATRLYTGGPGEIRSFAQAFNGVADHLAQTRQQQFEFLAGVAHDLRNPLTALKANAELLKLHPPAAESLPASLDMFLRQIERLNNMVQDLLDATRIEAGHIELKPAWSDLRLILQDTVALFAASSNKHSLAYENPSEPVMVYCDPHRIVQVLNNLVNNAIKYSPKGGIVRLELFTDERLVTVAVSDQGIGIKPEELVTIFEPFQRSTTVRGTIPGLGLGLPISKKIIEAHGGDIRIKSKVGEGSRFEFWLPKHPDGIRPS